MKRSDLLRHVRLFPIYLRLSFLRLAENKLQIWGAFFTSIVNFAAYVVFWNIITLQIPVLTGVGWVVWGRGELTILIGMTEIAWGFGAFFWMGVWQIHYYITEVGIEQYQIRPISSIYQILSENLWAGGVIQMGIGVIMILLSALSFGLVLVPFGVALGVLALFLGQGALYVLWANLCSLAFWIGRNQGLLEVSDAFEWSFARMPIDIMPNGIQYFLTFVFPVIFISTVPTMMMLGQLPLSVLLLYVGVAGLLLLFWSVMFRFVWSKGLKVYQPVGG